MSQDLSLSPGVLLVDDNPANLVVLDAVLEPLGVRLVHATSGAEALERVATDSFAVVLLDVQMPGMDGLQVARRLRETAHGRELPIIFLTAIYRDETYSRRGYEAGAADYITKPFDVDVLRARVKAFVDLYRQRSHQERDHLERILSTAPAMIAMYRGREHACVFANPAARAGRSEVEVVGKSALDLRAGPEAIGLMDRVFDTGETTNVDEFRPEADWMGTAGAASFLRLTIQATRSASGAIDGVLVFAIDVTTEVRARRELELFAKERTQLLESERAARDAAESANRAKDEFLATVSHELRTPLNAILGWTVVARRLAAGTEVDRALATIERNAQAQTRIIDDVVDVSRMTSGRLRVEIESTDVTQAIDGAVQSVRPAADARGVQLELVVDERIGTIAADAERLQQIVWNVLSNAIKFTPRGGRVELSAKRTESAVVIRVADNGQGIRREFLSHLFEPFRQQEGGTTRRHGGLGLGLAIVQRLVRAHGGTVSAQSDGEGRGATFTIELPLGPQVPQANRSRSEPAALGPPVAPLEHLTLLVVDDDQDSRELLVRVLGDQGAVVLSASSADAAIKVLEEFRPDVLVSDIAMPDIDGYDLIRKIRRLPATRGGRTPAIALTAYARPEDAELAVSAGFQAHASKPVHPGRLIAIIAELADGTGAPVVKFRLRAPASRRSARRG